MTLARRRSALLIALALAGGALAGCGLSATNAPSSTPTARYENTDAELDATWLHNGRVIGLIASPGSACFASWGEATLEADGSLAVTLVHPPVDTTCTHDVMPRVTLVGVPEGVDPSNDLAITVTGDEYSESTELDGVDGLTGWVPITEESVTDWEPSAGWTRTEGQFVLLTYGSSSCAPVITDIAASGPAEVTIVFETPPVDRFCTTDMGSRAIVASVDGLEADRDVTLTLDGSPEFENVSFPIYGRN